MTGLLLLWSAAAQDYRAPFGDADYGYFYPTAYYDHSGADWACGSIRYSGHRGSDFGGGSWSGMEAGLHHQRRRVRRVQLRRLQRRQRVWQLRRHRS